MSTIPAGSNIELLQWCEQHYSIWETVTPATIGLTTAQITEFKGLVTDARGAFDRAAATRILSKQHTTAQNVALREMRRDAGELVNTIKAFIEDSGNPALWATAGLTPPAPRGTLPPPTAPFDLSASLDSEGNLTIRWKASQPQGVTGVVYFVRRILNGTGNYQTLDVVGEKSYVDATIPEGTRTVSYVVVARRGGQESQPSPACVVRFGRAAGGGAPGTLTIESVETEDRLAA